MPIRLPDVLKYLRNDLGLTQKQLAKETGLSLSSIVSYENGLREPNSKAMAVLERYFSVSGEYLRGELDRDRFSTSSKIIDDGLDDIVVQLELYKKAFSKASQDQKVLSTTIFCDTVKFLTNSILSDNNLNDISIEEYIGLLSIYLRLNKTGRSELLKRAEELTQISVYCDIKDSV